MRGFSVSHDAYPPAVVNEVPPLAADVTETVGPVCGMEPDALYKQVRVMEAGETSSEDAGGEITFIVTGISLSAAGRLSK